MLWGLRPWPKWPRPSAGPGLYHRRLGGLHHIGDQLSRVPSLDLKQVSRSNNNALRLDKHK